MQPDSPLAHTKHIFRVLFLLVIGIVVLVLGRSLFLPDTWGEYGFYRGASAEEYSNLPVMHHGNASCRPCHEENVQTLADGVHHNLRCELCHAPLTTHVTGEEVTAEMPVRKSADLCLLCHRKLEARPADFPQIQARQHVEENGGEYGPEACFDCHDPHSPF
jgi:hypothetical protein